MRPTAALFDLDGTLIDHFRAIWRCHSYAMRKLGLPEPTLEQVRQAVGGGLELAITRLAGERRIPAIRPLFIEHWDATNLEDVILLPGALELLQALRAAGIPAAVLTNKRGPAAREVCEHLGLTPFLRGVYGADDTPWVKPRPEFTAYALERMGLSAAGTVLVGDSPFDVATARAGHLGFVGVPTGTHTAAELRTAGGTIVVDDLFAVGREWGLATATPPA